jgi:glycosyltransferase involved in cell wall biosynthesis
MRIIALVKNRDSACCRYRLAAFRPYLEAAGHVLELRPWPSSFLSRMRFGRDLDGADVLILQRKMPPPWQLALFRELAGRLVFDVDDAIFLHDSFDPRGSFSARRARRFREVVQTADVVIVGNTYLREQASLWVDPRRVEIIPTCVDATLYRPAAHHDAARDADLVWIGSSSTLRGLRQIRPMLEALGDMVPGLRFKIICDDSLQLTNMDVVSCPWSAKTEAAELAKAAIGLSWLPDDPWSRGKCGLKTLQYMAAGLPVIANPVGIHLELIHPAETGFLVQTAEELAIVVRRLLADVDLRRRLGQQGQVLVRRKFDVPLGATQWLELLGKLQSTTLARREAVGR